MSKKAWIIFAAVVVAIFGGLVYFSNSSKIDVGGIDHTKAITETSDKVQQVDNILGTKDNRVTLVEYGDFQCPGCKSFYDRSEKTLEEYKDKVTFVFRNFPISQIHPNARAAAGAAEAAAKQGKYWVMYNRLFGDQATWRDLKTSERDQVFVNFAKEAGLDVDQFSSDLGSTSVSRKITFDQALGKANGVSATPTLILNGRTLSDISTDEALRKELDNELKNAGIDPPKQ